MATETVLDYLGRPCMLAAARERYDDEIEAARELSVQELTRFLGEDLMELEERDLNAHSALNLALKSLPNSTDTDEVRALLTMAIGYGAATANKAYVFAGRVLVALEHGKLMEVSHA